MTELQPRKDDLSQDTADCCDHYMAQDISEECVSLVARTHKLGLTQTSLAHQTTSYSTRCDATRTDIGFAVLGRRQVSSKLVKLRSWSLLRDSPDLCRHHTARWLVSWARAEKTSTASHGKPAAVVEVKQKD